MSAAWRRVRARLRRFRLVEDGVAAVEFALVLPIMLLLYIGSVEASVLISLDRKLQSVAGSLGDLVARWDTTIPSGTLDDYFQAAAGIMTPHSTDGLLQVVTQVQVDEDGTATVVWSRQYLNGTVSVGTEHLEDAPFELPPAMEAVALDNFVIVAESSYTHLPLYGVAFQEPIQLYRENFFMPRFGGSITIGP